MIAFIYSTKKQELYITPQFKTNRYENERKKCLEIYPGPKILKLARNISLPITFASDSHNTGQVAWNFDALARYAFSEGWKESMVFRKGEVSAIPFAD